MKIHDRFFKILVSLILINIGFSLGRYWFPKLEALIWIQVFVWVLVMSYGFFPVLKQEIKQYIRKRRMSRHQTSDQF